MHDDPSNMVQATVLIAFDDQSGHHSEGSTIMLPAGTSEEVDNLRRLVDYSIVNAQVPGNPTHGVSIPDPAELSVEMAPPPPPPPPIPMDVDLDPLSHLPQARDKE